MKKKKLSLISPSVLNILNGDSLTLLRTLPSDSAHCCVTSPPYYRQRDYGVVGQLGQEQSVDDYVKRICAVFNEVKRVLHPTGTLWLNLGDSCINKNLCLIPSRVAIALQADGWILRNQIVWAKKAPMPESCQDRPTNAWEPVFLFSKSYRYYYDAEAVRELTVDGKTRRNLRNVWSLGPEPLRDMHYAPYPSAIPRNAIRAGTSAKGCCPICLAPWERIVRKTRILGAYGGLRKRADAPGAVTSASSVFRTGASVVTETIGWEPGCQCGAGHRIPCAVLDPFSGSGTTGMVAMDLNRRVILMDLNPAFCEMSRRRSLTGLLEVFDKKAI
jgi:DNA modification methylase